MKHPLKQAFVPESHPGVIQFFVLPRCKCKFGDASDTMLSLLQGLELRGVQQIFDGQNHRSKAPEVHRSMAVTARWTWKRANHIGAILAHRWIWTNPRVVHAVLGTIGMDLSFESFDRGSTHTIKTCSSKQFGKHFQVKKLPGFFVSSLKNHSSGRNIGAPLVKRGRLAMAPMPPWISLNGPMTKVSELRMVLLVSHQHPNTRPEHPKKPKKCRIFFEKKWPSFQRVRFHRKKRNKNSETLDKWEPWMYLIGWTINNHHWRVNSFAKISKWMHLMAPSFHTGSSSKAVPSAARLSSSPWRFHHCNGHDSYIYKNLKRVEHIRKIRRTWENQYQSSWILRWAWGVIT